MEQVSLWASDAYKTSMPVINQWVYGSDKDPGHGVTILTILIIGFAAYYLGSRLLARLVKRIVRSARHREWHKKDIEKRQNTLAALFTNMWRILVIVVIVLTIIREIFPQIDLAPLFASAGIIGVALGFGAQSIIRDFLSGIFIISENQYRVGDIVEIEGFSGTVERIGTRSTVIRDVDGNVHYFPNGMVMHVINKTMGYSMARFIVAIHPSSDIDKVVAIVNKLGTKLADEEKWKPRILEAPAFVSIGELTGTSVEIIIAGKTQPSDQWAVIAEMRRRLLQALEDADIELAITPSYPMQPPK
jgi:moderate conductance mechanosensitive channel